MEPRSIVRARRRGADVTDPRRDRFEALAAEVYEPLQRYVRRRIDAATVDDVVADTLLVCWRRLDDVPADAPVAWTLGVARRCLANDRRGARRQAAVGHRLAAQPEVAIAAPDVEVDLHAAVRELAEIDREIVLLWAWEGLAPREIAVALGLSANAVSIRLHRLKQRLAERLGGSLDHDGDHDGEPRTSSEPRKNAGGDGHDTGTHPTPDGEDER